jgi:hypothetical protein
MINFVLLLGCAIVLYLALNAAGELHSRFAPLLFAGYALRMGAHFLTREVQFFSHEVGGDSMLYEWLGAQIAAIWERDGIHFVTADEIPAISAAALPPNLFAFVMYLNGGGRALLGCTSLCALAACLCALNLYSLSKLLGASERAARFTALALLFSPAFVLYSADTYKDAIVLFFVLGAFGSSLRLIRRYSLLHAVLGLLSLWALWYVRYYLVFAALGPLVVGIAGLNSKSIARPVLATLAIAAVLVAVSAYSGVLNTAADTAQATFETGTGAVVRTSNATKGGSGVVFDDGNSIYGALHLKILYTLFAPFPWQGGSFGLQVGKIDATVSAFYFYRALVAGKRLLKVNRGVVLTFAVFVIPLTIVYALGVANIGLILRQRIPIVVALMLFGSDIRCGGRDNPAA